MIVAILLGYLFGIFAFCLWDSWIGMPVNWNDGTYLTRENMPLGLAAVFWPLATLVVALIKFNKYLDEAKVRRIQREEHKQKLRIAAQVEMDSALEQMDLEMKNASVSKKV